MLGIERWRHRHLLTAWAVYWFALVVVKLGGAIAAVLRVSGPAAHGSAAGSFGDKGVTVTVTQGALTTWTGTSTLSAIALWVAGPPLALWLVWMLSRPRRGARPTLSAGSDALSESRAPRPLNAAPESYDRARRSGAREEVPELRDLKRTDGG